MTKYADIATGYHAGYRELAKAIPGTTKAFGSLVHAATQDEALSKKTKELIAFAIAIAIRCEGCIATHANAALKAGASREEVTEMIGVAIFMGGGPSSVYGVEAMRAFDEFMTPTSTGR